MLEKNQSKKFQFHTDDNSGLSLENGSRVAVVGGGPADVVQRLA